MEFFANRNGNYTYIASCLLTIANTRSYVACALARISCVALLGSESTSALAAWREPRRSCKLWVAGAVGPGAGAGADEEDEAEASANG